MGIIVSGIEFDARVGQVVVSGIEFDCRAPVPPAPDSNPDTSADSSGGAGRRTALRSNAKSSPAPAPSHYHSRSDEQEIARLAAQLDDEEIVLAYLMELALV